jgi:hypothetical protein
VEAALDGASAAQRLANDLGASALVFVADEQDLPPAGDIDLVETERRIADHSACGSELKAAARFVRAGGEVAALTTAVDLAEGVDGPADAVRTLRIHLTAQPTPRSTMAKIRATAPIRSIDDVTSGIPWLSGSSPRR